MDQNITQQIQLLLAENKTTEALDQLLEQNMASGWKETLLVLKANLLNVDQQLMQGVVDHSAAQLQYNRINSGALKVLTYLEGGTGDPGKILNEFKEKYSTKNITTNTTNISDSNINIDDSEGVVIGSGNTVTQKIFKALGKKQFWAILIGLILIIVLGTWGGKKLFAQQEGHYHSLNDIKKELVMLADLNKNVKKSLDENGTELNDWLEKGAKALKNGDNATVVQYLEKVVAQLPAATIHQNLAIAYEGLGNEKKAKDHLNKANNVNPNIKLPMGYASFKGKRINLLLKKNGAEILRTSNRKMSELTNVYEGNVTVYLGSEITYGFFEERKATVDLFTTLITQASNYNVKEFELFYGNDSPDGNFTSLGIFKADNQHLGRTPYQEFKFKKTTAKYFRFKLLSVAGGERNSFAYIPEIQLWGEIE